MKKLLLLLSFAYLPLGMMAEGEYPNVLVIRQANGSEEAFPLAESTLKIIPMTGNVTVIADGSENSFALSDITDIKYEYRDLSTLGINGITLGTDAGNAIYGMDGRKLSTESLSLQEALHQLPHGVYIIKTNGRTLKIAK